MQMREACPDSKDSALYDQQHGQLIHHYFLRSASSGATQINISMAFRDRGIKQYKSSKQPNDPAEAAIEVLQN